MTAFVDLIGTGDYTESSNGIEQTITIRVTGVAGDVWHKRQNALLAPGVPRLNEPHRSVPGIFVRERRVTPVDTNTFDVAVLYGPPIDGLTPGSEPAGGAPFDRSKRYGPTRWSGGTQVITEATEKDANGHKMLLFYNGRPVLDLANLSTGEVVQYDQLAFYRAAAFVAADVDRPLLALTAARWERDDPLHTARNFGGMINADQWRTFPPKTVLATEFEFEPHDDGGYNTTYRFTFNARGWDLIQFVRVNGHIPVDAVEGNGILTRQIYKSAQFSTWSL